MDTMNSNYKNLSDFLQKHRVGKGAKHTHTSMGGPLGAFNIDDNELDTFFDLYEVAVQKGTPVYMIEKHTEVAPIIVDLDFKLDYDITERQYTKEHVKKIVELYMTEIEQNFKLTDKSNELIAFVFERSKPYQTDKGNKITKDGIHIMFPYISTEPYAQYMLRDNILKKIDTIFTDIKLRNPMSDVVDRCIIQKNGWLMYGSKKPNCDPYKLSIIYDSHREVIEHNDVDFKGFTNLAKFLSIRRHEIGDCVKLQDDSLTAKYKKKTTKINIKSKKKIYNLDEVVALVDILDIDRAHDFEKWMEVGICLNSVDPTELFEVWDEFSQKSSKYDNAYCIKKWDEITQSNKTRKELTIASLIYWARNDNFDKFMEIKRVDVQRKLEDTLRTTIPNNWDIAKVLYEMFQNQYVYSRKCWYEFKDHRWVAEEDGLCLRQKISVELVQEYLRLNSQYNELAADAGDEGDDAKKEEYLNQTKKIIKIIGNVKMTGFKDNVMKECRELFQDNKFCNKLDTHEYLIGFENGVYDLKEMEFRDGRPEDYITLSTGNSYVEYYDEDGDADEIEDFMAKIITDDDVRLYMLTLLSSFLQGVNAEEKFRIWTGTGSNGKSKLLELFISSFGDYCIKFPITLLTGKRAASNACTPEIVQAVGKRFGYFDEPNEDERINVGLMKEYTGGDKIKARGLHQAPIEFKPQFKLVLLCNDLPKVPPNDEGTWRRLEVAEFKSKFVGNPTEPHEFERDNYLSDKIKRWKSIFLSWLIDKYYRIYKTNGIIVPPEVLKYTTEYKKESDKLIEFIEDILVKSPKSKDTISVNDLYDDFKMWISDNYAENKVEPKKTFLKLCIKKFKKSNISGDGNNMKVKGFIYKTKDESLSETAIMEI